jgi:hypothetical protein
MLSVLISSNNETEASVKNIGEGGICITTKIRLLKGRFIKLMFTLPDGAEMSVNGQVAWSLEIGNDTFENGIDFLQLTACYKERLVRYLN